MNPPPLPTGLARRRALVDQIRDAQGLCIVRGGIGVGKTFLAGMAAVEAREAGSLVVWADVATLAGDGGSGAEVWAAVARHLERMETPLKAGPIVVPAPVEKPVSAAEATDAVRRAVLAAGGGVVLVLDDVDRCEDPALAEWVVGLVRRLPGILVVATSRQVTALESRLVRARVDVTRIGPDLALDAADVAELLGDRDTFDDETAARLLEATGGHALTLGMLLVVLAETRRDPGVATAQELGREAARCAGEILDSTVTPEQQRALGPLAVPLRLTRYLARAIAGDAALDLLDQAQASGLGAWSARTAALVDSDDGGVFDMLGVFRRALRDGLRRENPGRESALLPVVVDASLDERGFAVAALAAVDSGEPRLLEEVCRAAWMELRHADLSLLARVMSPVQAWPVERYPTVALTLGLMIYQDPARQRQAEHFFQLAASGLGLFAPSDSAERAYLGTVRSMAQRFLGLPEEAALSATAALGSLREVTIDDGARLPGHAFLVRNIASALFVAGYSDTAGILLQEAYDEEDPDSDSALLTACLLALVLGWGGEAAAAERLTRSHPPMAEAVAALGSYGANALLRTRAILALERRDGEALAAALEGVRSQPTLLDEFAPLGVITEMLAELSRGRLAASLEVLAWARAHESYASTAPVWRARQDALGRLVRTAAGDGADVLRELQAARQGPPEPGDRFVHLLDAALLLAADDVEGARSTIGETLGDDDGKLTVARLLEAAIAVRAGDREKAGRMLAIVRERAHEGSLRGWLLLTRADREALEAVDPDAVAHLVSRNVPVVLPVAEAPGGVGSGAVGPGAVGPGENDGTDVGDGG
ncbi:hypothetical protein C8046_12030 [Serinibacter arcticus]|uniref:AAA+ ATPase domain-containing protein n=1 Tax=Serinibacter arcticus TaxID=1655435 RepID=A0A2U1ZWA9_9MICO|nr:hypothetical protein [Serinibacter arcticus]PWD51277.1 hypothetical protein C8046_12030 [Serinibacter arcticus]